MIGKIAIGIDLGTTFSCVAVFQNGKVEIIENKSTGLKTTPSVVTFNNNERLIGKPSKISENTVCEVKRLIGRSYDEEILKHDFKNWPFKVINNNSKPMIEINTTNQIKNFHPEEISAMVLSKLKEIASLHLNQEIKDAVITVPAYFNDSQRQATIDASRIAGLNVLRIINEPTAAAIAYGYDKRIMGKKNILIFDLGGGTFDVSIVSVEKNPKDIFKVIAIGGDTHLGGVDFTNRMVDHFVENYKKKHGKDVSKDKRAIHRLRNECETAKRYLSESLETTIEIDAFCEGDDFVEKISRALFEQLNEDYFNKTIKILNETIKDSKLSISEIDEVVLVGGSTRIPKIQALLKNFFNGKQCQQTINADEAVAYGAAIQAAMLSDCANQKEGLLDLQFIDAIPLSLGIDIRGTDMSVIIPRNTNIPCSKTANITTLYHNQQSVRIGVYEGERLLVKDNYLLGEFCLHDIEHGKAGVPKVVVTFTIDANGILNVSAMDKKTMSMNNIVIQKTKGHLSENEINNMLKLSKVYEQQDKKQLEKLKAKNDLEVFIYNEKLSNGDHERNYLRQLNDSLSWLNLNDSLTKERIYKKLKSLKILKEH